MKWVDFLKKRYPAGTVIKIESIYGDPTLKGKLGMINRVTDTGYLHTEICDSDRSIYINVCTDNFDVIL